MLKPVSLTCEYLKSPLSVGSNTPRFAWRYRGKSKAQKAYQITVQEKSSSAIILWDSGKQISANCVHIEYQGKALKSFCRYKWTVTVWDENSEQESASAEFSTGCFDNTLWQGMWIGKNHKAPTYYKKEFCIETLPESAIIYASALGVYDVFINGQKLDKSYFNPGWTDYRQRIQYQSFDATPLLKHGENEITATVADGWYCGNIAIVGREMYGTYPLCFFAELRSGENIITATDKSWLCSAGPLISSDLQTGEVLDMRVPFNWQQTDFVRNDLSSLLCSQISPPIIETFTLPAKLVSNCDGVQIFDFGQNFAGWVQIKIKSSNGMQIQLRHGEMLTNDGKLYTENLRTAKQTDVFILADDSEIILKPQFTYHGFRYVEISGAPEISENNLTGICLCSDLPETMRFQCNDPLINKLWQNIMWGQRGNFFSVPTDCPQRDERMGWTGDTQIFCKTACFNMDSAAYYESYLRNLFDAQYENGAITDVVPYVFKSDGSGLVGAGNAAWGDAAFIIPYVLYQMYGDKRPIHLYYKNMQRYMDYLKTTSPDGIRPDTGYGDWLSVGADTPIDLLSTAYYALAAKLMAKMAEVIGNKESADEYKTLFNKISDAFRKQYVSEDGFIKGDTQTCYLLALRFGLLLPQQQSGAINYLLQNIGRHGNHLTTGFVGVSYLLPTLSDCGQSDLAYTLLTTKTYPSWLYPVLNGATTVWERWNSYTVQDGFGDVGMNSFNHYSLGSVAEWFYTYVAGIQITHDINGNVQFVIMPYICGFDWIKAEYNSIYGMIKVHWDKELLTVVIPDGHAATIILPNGKKQMVYGENIFEL